MFTIYGGKTEFEQWAIDQLVTCSCLQAGDAVVFRGHGKVYETTAFEQGGEVWADVPNFLLQKPGSIRVDLGWGLDGHINCRTYFDVIEKERPANYVCEYNIKNRNVSSSMGGADWNASEGEPGHVLNRPFYDDFVAESEWLPETVCEITEDMEGSFLLGEKSITAGATYKVTWNGVEYICVAEYVVGIGANAFGNMSYFDENLKGYAEPFAVAVADGQALLITFEALPLTATVSIVQGTIIVQQIPEKFVDLTNATPVWLEPAQFNTGIPLTFNVNGEPLTGRKLAEIVKSGRPVFVRFSENVPGKSGCVFTPTVLTSSIAEFSLIERGSPWEKPESLEKAVYLRHIYFQASTERITYTEYKLTDT